MVFKAVAERRRRALLGARLLGVWGEVQRESGVTYLIARRLADYSGLVGGLVTCSRDPSFRLEKPASNRTAQRGMATVGTGGRNRTRSKGPLGW